MFDDEKISQKYNPLFLVDDLAWKDTDRQTHTRTDGQTLPKSKKKEEKQNAEQWHWNMVDMVVGVGNVNGRWRGGGGRFVPASDEGGGRRRGSTASLRGP